MAVPKAIILPILLLICGAALGAPAYEGISQTHSLCLLWYASILEDGSSLLRILKQDLVFLDEKDSIFVSRSKIYLSVYFFRISS